MRINRIGNIFGSSFNPTVNGVQSRNSIKPVDDKPQEQGSRKQAEKDAYIPSNPDGRVIPNNNYDSFGYLMQQAENSAKYDNFDI